jgi:pilus assembly protein CpaE
MSVAKVLLYIKNENLRRETLDALRASSGHVPFEQSESDWNSLLDQLGRIKPEVLLLDVSAVPSELAIAIRQIKVHAPRAKVMALHASDDPKVILAAMRAGVSEFLHLPFEESLPSALERILSTSDAGTAVPPHRGKVIGFLSAKGGCGATTLACHVALELQHQTAKNVLLADLDLVSGMLGFLMKTSSSYSILDAVKNAARLDESLWKALLVESRPNLYVIPAPASYTRWDQPDDEQLRQVLQFVRTQHDWTVLDLGRSLNPTVTAVLDEIDHLLLVSTIEVAALHGLKSIAQGLFAQGEKLQLVLNRTPKTMDVSTGELEKILGRSLYAALPNDYMGLYQSYSSGNLLNSNSRLAQYFGLLAAKIAGLPPAKAKKKFAIFG